MSPGSVSASHGDMFEATRMLTIFDWWRPIVLKVSVGQCSSVSRISPYGTRPSLMRAWKPLQIPSIRPSRLFSISMVAFFTASFRKKEVMNFAEPSGSSPPEKPPGMKIICDSAIRFATCSTESLMSCFVILRTTMISGSSPASAQAFAESYSQLLPGKTGIRTCGFSTWMAGATHSSSV